MAKSAGRIFEKLEIMIKQNKELKKITQKIVEKYKPKKIILFGSCAWGKPTEDSDVDLFIVKNSRKRRIDRERELRTMLIGNNFPPMDLLIYTSQELKRRFQIGDFFINDIFKKGKVLYDEK